MLENELKCPACESKNIKKNGKNRNSQRFMCKDCLRTFTNSPARITQSVKHFGLMMYLNNVGIRKIAKFLKVSPPAVLKWIKNAHKLLEERLQFVKTSDKTPDIIEFDEIYTYIKKNKKEQSYGLLILENKVGLLHLK